MSRLQKRPTQRDKVLSYIQQFGSITSWQAYSDLGVTQLGARIWELKKQGHIFDKTRVNTTNRLGEKTHYDIYTLVKEN